MNDHHDKTIVIAGRPLSCLHCGGEQFEHERVEFGATGGTPFRQTTAAMLTDVFRCEACGRLEFFNAPAIAPPATVRGPALECPRCNLVVGPTAIRCEGCGWTRE